LFVPEIGRGRSEREREKFLVGRPHLGRGQHWQVTADAGDGDTREAFF
jgi:hypothetical protein